MSYEYVDPKRESDPHALPDMEVFHNSDYPMFQGVEIPDNGDGYYYAYGLIGCMWDSDPIGPFSTYEDALANARENAGVYDE